MSVKQPSRDSDFPQCISKMKTLWCEPLSLGHDVQHLKLFQKKSKLSFVAGTNSSSQIAIILMRYEEGIGRVSSRNNFYLHWEKKQYLSTHRGLMTGTAALASGQYWLQLSDTQSRNVGGILSLGPPTKIKLLSGGVMKWDLNKQKTKCSFFGLKSCKIYLFCLLFSITEYQHSLSFCRQNIWSKRNENQGGKKRHLKIVAFYQWQNICLPFLEKFRRVLLFILSINIFPSLYSDC